MTSTAQRFLNTIGTGRAHLTEAIRGAGLHGTAAELYFGRLTAHRAGLKHVRGDKPVPYPTPPDTIRKVELELIDAKALTAAALIRQAMRPAPTIPPAIPPERAPAAMRDRGRSWGES